MSTIEIDTMRINQAVVIAYDPASTAPSRKAGNIVASHGETLNWQCKNNAQSFLVSFNLPDDDDKPTWPFGNDQADHIALGVQYLRVDSKTPKSRKLTITEPLKYTIKDETVPIARELDPMIVIRPSFLSKIALGLAWGAVGALVGFSLARIPW